MFRVYNLPQLECKFGEKVGILFIILPVANTVPSTEWIFEKCSLKEKRNLEHTWVARTQNTEWDIRNLEF